MTKKFKKSNQKSNRLINEKSPYLLQHAHNPVDWYPWCEEAFEKAKVEDKPIFLSIGYSTCHWCHVMAEESFEDSEVAKLMNDTFISIKVDREERPDIDKVYMLVCQSLTGSGGWPLSIIMTSDKRPFFAATYIPKQSRFRLKGMLEIIPSIQNLWKTKKHEVLDSANRIRSSIAQQIQSVPLSASKTKELDDKVLTTAYNHLVREFDYDFGGFGSAPKFPSPHNLLFLLRYWKRKGEQKALQMVEMTLDNMRRGGIFDQVGFGFHRYSTDATWLVPHFEKMLYDQALLALAYTEAYQVTKEESYKNTAEQIFEYVLRDMTAKNGGFYSAEDADSDGEEGKFYLWTEEEIIELFNKDDVKIIKKVYGIYRNGNYIDEIIGKTTGKNILHLKNSLSTLASELNIPEEQLQKRIEKIREKLFDARSNRTHPHKDDKILTDWNGLMIAALAKGAQVFSESKYLEAASAAAEFILNNMVSNGKGKGNGLLHRYRAGSSGISANLDDYAFFIWGLIELYETTFDPKFLDKALDFNSYMLEHFWDNDNGGLYFAADNNEKLLIRNKEIYDGAIPSGNSIALLNMLRLSKLSKNPKLEAKAEQLARTFYISVSRHPAVHTQFLIGLDFAFGPSFEVLIEGNIKNTKTKDMLKALRTHFIPNKITHMNYNLKQTSDEFKLPVPAIGGQEVKDEPIAYVCVNYSCQKPTSDINEMLELLGIK